MGKKIGLFFILALAILGSAGLLVFLILQRAWPLIPGLLAVCLLAWPKAKSIYDYITGDE